MKVIFVFLLCIGTIYAQQKEKIYSVTVGKYKCFSNYFYEEPGLIGGISGGYITTCKNGKIIEKKIKESKPKWESLSTVGGEIYNVIYFPARIDTTIYAYSECDNVPRMRNVVSTYKYKSDVIIKTLDTTDHYGMVLALDTISKNEIDSLINSEVIVWCNNKKIKPFRYRIGIIYADGKRADALDLHREKIIENVDVRTLFRRKDVLVIYISYVEFRDNKNWQILDSYGWFIPSNSLR